MNRTINPQSMLELTARLYDSAEDPQQGCVFLEDLRQLTQANLISLVYYESGDPNRTFQIVCGTESDTVVTAPITVQEMGCRNGILQLQIHRLAMAEPLTQLDHEILVAAVRLMAKAISMSSLFLTIDKTKSTLTLSPRQREILSMAAKGKGSKEIAACLSLSTRTVEHHFTAASKRLHTKKRSQTVALAMEMGLLDP